MGDVLKIPIAAHIELWYNGPLAGMRAMLFETVKWDNGIATLASRDGGTKVAINATTPREVFVAQKEIQNGF